MNEERPETTPNESPAANEIPAETAPLLSAEQADTAEASAAPRKRKKRVVLLCLLALLLAAAVSAPFAAYEYARQALAQERYDTAVAWFERLGDFRDSAALCSEAKSGLLYTQANALMDSCNYAAAAEIYQTLEAYRDSDELLLQAKHMLRVVKKYEAVEANFLDGGYLFALRDLRKIEDEPYPPISELKGKLLDAIYERMMEQWYGGSVLSARRQLKLLEEEGYPAVEGLRDRLREELRMEPDTSYYDAVSPQHITVFNAATTEREYAAVFEYMAINNIGSLTLRVNGRSASSSAIDRRLCRGYDLLAQRLPELAYVYNVSWWMTWDASQTVQRIDLTLTPAEAGSLKEAAEHVSYIRSYCEEVLRALNEELLLTNTMSHREKAYVILNWVDHYLDYDDDKAIHDAFTAIREERGVCTCYTALYNCLCRLAGVPTLGQVGDAGESHIWSVQLDEDGKMFYTDATWADSSWSASHGTSVDDLADYVDELLDYLPPYLQGVSRAEAENDPLCFLPDYYFWQETLWDSHTATVEAPDFSFFTQQATQKSA